MVRKSQVEELHVDDLVPGRFQPRREFNVVALEELAQSIQTAGLIQPIVVRSLAGGQFEIIAGERRWRAAKLASWETVPCLIRDCDDPQAATVATIENIQREDLNPIEEAHSFSRLIQEFDYSHDDVAALVGKSRVYVTNALRLLKLAADVQAFLKEGLLKSGHGKILASLSESQQLHWAKQCADKQWSVRQLETEIKKHEKSGAALAAETDPNIQHLEQSISEQFGAKVKLDQEKPPKGWIKIRYTDHETLEGILDKLGVNYEVGEDH